MKRASTAVAAANKRGRAAGVTAVAKAKARGLEVINHGAGTMPVVWAGIGLGAFNLALAVICYKLLKSGWKIKA